MSSTTIPPKTVVALWTRAGGRCEYEGHNELLWRDDLTSADINVGLIAHIVADSPDGPRGDPVRSPQLAKKLSNLMLLCHAHHRLIDIDDVSGHPEDRLVAMKRAHETRIERLTSIGPEMRTQIVSFRTVIGEHRTSRDSAAMREAVAVSRYPVPEELHLDLTLDALTERDPAFWQANRRELESLFDQRLRWRLAEAGAHFSVFALAPISLLIAFGRLLGDKTAADVYQKHRVPCGWQWAMDAPPLEYHIKPPDAAGSAADVVIVLSVTDTVQTPHVDAFAPQEWPRYQLRIDHPRLDIVRCPDDVARFRGKWIELLSTIRATHHVHAPRLHIFPAIPNSLAVELGRSLLPKAHSPLRIYDLNGDRDGFVFTLEL
ncbi:MAG: SAVED domain-containing protein [Deltaproteobacteria bacterium]|nr:SAVED domain-containing protein [Deltaproteobacteria bacterium]